MINPCECCERKIRFIRKINGNFMHSLVIPEWFVSQLGGKIWRTIKLQAPEGIIYDVGVSENMNRIILKSGWAAFLDANEIEENYSLMFRYLGNSIFEVTIFDSNGKEKVSHSHYTDNSSSSHPGATQSSAGEGSDSDGSQKESSYWHKKSAKMPAISYSSEEFSAEDNSVESDDQQMLSKYCVFSGRCYLTEAQKAKLLALVKKVRPEIPVLVDPARWAAWLVSRGGGGSGGDQIQGPSATGDRGAAGGAPSATARSLAASGDGARGGMPGARLAGPGVSPSASLLRPRSMAQRGSPAGCLSRSRARWWLQSRTGGRG